MTLDPLHSAIREACSEAAWSQGVRLARAGQVRGEADDGEELRLRVGGSARASALLVHLWPEDEDWACDCEQEACAHAAAAIISLRLSRRQGKSMPKPSGSLTLVYELERSGAGLRVRRLLEQADGQRRPMSGPLRQQTGLQLRPEDRTIDEVLQVAGARMPSAGWRRLLSAWSALGARLKFEEHSLRADPRPVLPVALVRDEGKGFKVSLHRAQEVEEVFADGLLRVGDALRPAGDGGLEAHQRTALVRGLIFGPHEVAQLVAELLPRLRDRVTVKVKTSRLPEGRKERPSLQLATRSRGQGLEVEAQLVYGDPPVARLERGQLVLLGGVVPIRDLEAERKLKHQLERSLRLPLALPTQLGEHEALAFVRDRLPGFKGAVRGDVKRFRIRQQPVSVRIGAQGGLESEANMTALVQAWQRGESLVRLQAGGYAPLPLDFMEQHGHLVADLVAARGADGQLPTHALPIVGQLAQALDQPPPADLARLRPLLEDFQGLPDRPLPAGLQAELRDYQLVGFRWVCFLWEAGLAGILADDMGLGKTVQALAALGRVRGPRLVIAPTSVLGNWQAEAKRFLPGLKVCLYHGSKRRLDPDADLVVSSYALMRLDPKLNQRRWAAVVLDESQAIKNPESQTAQAAFGLKADRRLTLTGTPVENRLDELWSQLHFLMPGFLGGRSGFRERYGKPIADGDHAAAAALRRRIGPFVLRRTKDQVAKELPSLTRVVLPCSMSAPQQAVYEAVRQSARAEVAQLVGGGKALQVLELLLRLRQAACHPGLLPGQDRSDMPSGKLDALLDKLQEVVEGGHKALVFSQWTGHLDLIERGVRQRGLQQLRLDGSTQHRHQVVQRFQSDDGPPVFLISLRAGGTGLNLTAADYVFHADPWWNPAVQQQATDRAHRIGQERPVVSVQMVSEDTVEERILALQEQKQALADAALGGGLMGAISRDELLALFD